MKSNKISFVVFMGLVCVSNCFGMEYEEPRVDVAFRPVASEGTPVCLGTFGDLGSPICPTPGHCVDEDDRENSDESFLKDEQFSYKCLILVANEKSDLHYAVSGSMEDLIGELDGAVSGSMEDLLGELEKAGTDINIRDSINMTALHYCAILGNAKMAQTLLGHGANINAVNNFADTPLKCALACFGEDSEIYKLLLSHVVTL